MLEYLHTLLYMTLTTEWQLPLKDDTVNRLSQELNDVDSVIEGPESAIARLFLFAMKGRVREQDPVTEVINLLAQSFKYVLVQAPPEEFVQLMTSILPRN